MMSLTMMRMKRIENIMYDPKFWRHCEGITVKQFCECLQEHIPPDAAMNVCGGGQFYMHLAKDRGVFSVDDCSLSDLPEYEDRMPGSWEL